MPTENETALIALDDMKLFLRVDTDEEDSLISSMLEAAIMEAEGITHRVIKPSVFEYMTNELGELSYVPCTGVTLSVNGVTVSSSLYSFVPSSFRPGGETPASCTASEGFPAGAIKVAMNVGYTASTLPAPIRQWIMARVSSLYEQRESFAVGTNFHEFGHEFLDALLDPYIVHGGF